MTDDRYPVPGAVTRTETDVRKSRFIATVARADSVAAAREFIQSIRDEFPDATHNCWAFVVGPPGSTRSNGAGDDGEPGGTAGRPMLGVLLNSGVGDIAVVVTRYFGGIKLGRGGLVHAYSIAVPNALRATPLGERRAMVTIRVVVPYAAVDPARRAIAAAEGRIDDESFGTDARLTVTCPAHRRDELEAALTDVTSGAARIE